MARIPLFFRSTFPVETYGALYDPGAMAVAAKAKSGVAKQQLSGVGDLINAYFAGNSPSFSYASGGRGGVNKRTEAPGILDRAATADNQRAFKAARQSAQDEKMSQIKELQKSQSSSVAPSRQSRAKIYKVPGTK